MRTYIYIYIYINVWVYAYYTSNTNGTRVSIMRLGNFIKLEFMRFSLGCFVFRLILATARQVKLSRMSWRISTGLWRVSSSGACLFSRSSEIGVPVGWTCVSEDVGFRFVERRRGRMNARGNCRELLLVP